MVSTDRPIRSYRDLLVWQKSMDLADAIYNVAEGLPPKEEYRLTGQIIRAAVSVPANIAEGHGRFGGREFANFLSIARGSLNETETLLLLAVRRGYVLDETVAPILALTAEIGRMINGLRSSLPSQR